MDGKLRFGQKLSENAYAKQFGVSRTPVREAILSLASLNLLTVRPQSGTFVVSFSAESLRHLFDVRYVLERSGVELAGPEERIRLAQALAEQACSTQHAHEAHSEAMWFHAQLVNAAQNPLLTQLYRPVQVCAQAVRSRLDRTPEMEAAAERDHQGIIAALQDDDFGRFEHKLKDHLEWVLAMLLNKPEILGLERA